jgi:hypothetical protein
MGYNTGVSEIWLDKQTGKLSIGRGAAGEYADYRSDYELDFPDEEPQLAPLPELITAKELDFPTGHFDMLDTSDYQRNDYVAYGHWILHMLEIDGQQRPLRIAHIRRVRKLGIGAAEHFLTKFGGLIPFKREIGGKFENSTGLYRHWGLADFIEYARTVATELGRKPEESDYDAYAKEDEGPGSAVIAHRVGTAKLNEYIGHPNIRSWDDDEFILWGAKALRANTEFGISRTVIDELSRLARGPSTFALARFGPLSKFQALVEEELERQDNEHRGARERKLKQYSELLEQGQVSSEYEYQPDDLIAVGGRFLVVNECIPSASLATKQRLSLTTSKLFIRAVLKTREAAKLTSAHIEAVAVMLDVFDDIWPIRENISHLHVHLERKRGRYQYKPGDYRRRLTRAA